MMLEVGLVERVWVFKIQFLKERAFETGSASKLHWPNIAGFSQ